MNDNPHEAEVADWNSEILAAHMAIMNEITDALGTATIARAIELNPHLSRYEAAIRADDQPPHSKYVRLWIWRRT